MQDNYVGDIGDYGKYGLLRAVTSEGLSLAVNWYRAAPKRPGKQDDGKYVSYLSEPEQYRHYDPALFDSLARLVRDGKRSVEAVEDSGILNARFYGEKLTGAERAKWHGDALKQTAAADVVFLDPDNGLETAKMRERRLTKDKHVTWQEVKDYYDRGQSVILYQHRPQMMKRTVCICKVLDFQNAFLNADSTFILEYPRYTNRYYFIFCHETHQARLEHAYRRVTEAWSGMCEAVDICRL